ncbi:MAG: hypothetical protein CMH83_03810 [Nocardioides sp.]|nr:hypothetical protein [Nocardioides sp.]
MADQLVAPLVTMVAPAAEFHAASLVLEVGGTHLMDLPGGAEPGWIRFTAPAVDLDRVRAVLSDVAPRARHAD